MKKLLILSLFVLSSCSTNSWQSQLQPNSLASQAVTAAARYYGGAKGADLASAGLYATADVLQGYVNKEPPIDIITKSSGVKGLGKVTVDWLVDKGVVTQTTINNVHKAAALAANMTEGNTK